MTFLFSIPQKVIITLLYNMYCEPSLRVFKNNPSLLSLTSPVYQFLPCCLLLPFSFLNYFINSYHTPTFSIKVLYSLPLWIESQFICTRHALLITLEFVVPLLEKDPRRRRRKWAGAKHIPTIRAAGRYHSWDHRAWT